MRSRAMPKPDDAQLLKAEGEVRMLTMHVNRAPTALEFPMEGEWREGEDFGLDLDYLKRALAAVRIRSAEGGEAEPEWVVMPVGLG